MKPRKFATFTSLLWLLLGTATVVVGIFIFTGNTTFTYSGSSIKSHLVLVYIGLGILFVLQAISVFKARIYSLFIPTILLIFSVVAMAEEISGIFGSNIPTYKYLIMYVFIFVVCALTIGSICVSRKECAKIHT